MECPNCHMIVAFGTPNQQKALLDQLTAGPKEKKEELGKVPEAGEKHE